MTTHNDDRSTADKDAGKRKSPPPTFSGDPEEALERKVREHPEDCDAKVDVGSDESMDASDPISVTRPQDSEPAPSSGFPDEDDDGKKG